VDAARRGGPVLRVLGVAEGPRGTLYELEITPWFGEKKLAWRSADHLDLCDALVRQRRPAF